MARKGKQRSKKKQPTQAQPQAQAQPQSNYAKAMDRRRAIQNIAIYGIGGAVLLGGAGLFAMDFRGKLQESQFADIGNGTPTVLQIHDPQCQLCQQLQKQARQALRDFDADAVQFRVADIRSTDGAEISSRYGVPHITLVLIEGDGTVAHVVRGVTPAEELARLFRRHLQLRPTG